LERALNAKPGAAAAAQLDAPGAARAAPAAGTAGSASASGAANDRTRRAMAEVRRELESLHKLLEH
jgi:hypothetical protein